MDPIQSNSQRTFLTLTFYTDCSGNITKDFLENPGSLASSKIQLLPMLKTAINNGDNVQIWSLHSETPQDLEIMLSEKNIDTVFIGKMSAGPISKQQSMILANTAAVLRLKQRGAKIILFYSDNHFERNDRIGEFYRSIFEFVDLFVTPSKTLEEIVRRKTNYLKSCITVVDPWQSQKNDFDDENIKNKARLIWFGQGRNIDYLISKIPTLLSQCEASKCYELTILSRADALRHFKKQLPKKLIGKKQWIFKFVAWDDFDQPSQFDKCLLDSSISLIPSDPNDPNKMGVSHNRLVDSIRSGCITIASPMPSYLELKDLCILTKNFPRAIDYAIENSNNLIQKFSALRDPILSQFSPASNQKTWKKIIQTNFKDINTKISNANK